MAPGGWFDARTDFPAWFTLGVPTLGAIYAAGIALQASRRLRA